jgi:hypothetical protein
MKKTIFLGFFLLSITLGAVMAHADDTWPEYYDASTGITTECFTGIDDTGNWITWCTTG